MKRSPITFTAAVVAGAALFAGPATAASAPRQAGDAAAKKKSTKLKLQDSEFGKVLFDGRGGALYMFTSDGRGPSTCYGDCAVAWPPFYAKGKLRGGPGVKAKLLGRTTRTDGRRQVTYGGRPLYYYEHDPRNQILCHDVFEFGGDWLVLQASGKPAPS